MLVDNARTIECKEQVCPHVAEQVTRFPIWFVSIGIFFISFLFLLTVQAYAGDKIIEARHTTLVGDNDSRHDAKTMCFTEAKRKALEQAGVVVRSLSETKDFTLEKDMVQVVTASAASIEEREAVWALNGDQLSVLCKVRVTVDEDRLAKRLEQAADNMDFAQKEQPSSVVGGNLDFAAGGAALSGTPGSKPGSKSDKLKTRRIVPSAPDVDRKMTMQVRKNVRKGMTLQAVYGELGKPQMVQRSVRGGSEFDCLRYGRAWLVFRDQQALCARKRLKSQKQLGICNCAGMGDTFYWR